MRWPSERKGIKDWSIDRLNVSFQHNDALPARRRRSSVAIYCSVSEREAEKDKDRERKRETGSIQVTKSHAVATMFLLLFIIHRYGYIRGGGLFICCRPAPHCVFFTTWCDNSPSQLEFIDFRFVPMMANSHCHDQHIFSLPQTNRHWPKRYFGLSTYQFYKSP